MATIAALVVKIQADTSDIQTNVVKSVETLGRLEAQVERNQMSMGKLAGAVALGTAAFHLLETGGRAAWEFLESTVDAAAEADAAMSRLTTAMKSQGNATPTLIDGYRKMSQEFQHSTTYSHDAIEGVMGTLIQLGDVAPANMKKALEATVNLAAGLGRDLEPTAQAVGKALGGNTTALSKLIPEIKRAGAEAKTAEGLLKILSESGFGGQAAAAATTYAGRVKQIGNEWTDLKETIGDAIVRNQTVRDAMSLVTDALIGQAGALEGNRAGFEIVSGAIIGFIQAAAFVVRSIDFIQTAIRGFMTVAELIVMNLANANAAVAQLAINAAVWVEKTTGTSQKATIEWARSMKDAALSVAFQFGEQARQDWQATTDLGNSLQVTAAKLDDMASSLEKTRGKEAETVAGIVKHRTALDDLGKAAKHAGDEFIDAELRIERSERAMYENRVGYLEQVGPQTGPLPLGAWASTYAGFTLPPDVKGSMTGFIGDQPKVIRDWATAIGDAGKTIGAVFQGINSTVGQTAQIVGHGFEQIGMKGASAAQKASAAFGMLGGVLSELAGGAPSKAMQMAMGGLGGAAAGAAVAGAIMGTTFSAATFGISIAVGALAGAILGWATATMKAKQATEEATKQTRVYEQDLLTTYGSLNNIAMLGNVVGVNLASAFGRSGTFALEQMNIQMAAFKKGMEALQGALDTYGLTWLDLNEDMKTFTIGNTAAKLVGNFELLTRAGASSDKVLKGMAASLSQFIVNAIKSGQEIPPAMAPILKQLILMGGLTEEAARAMLGLSANTMPSLANIKAAAERYGLTLDQLGGKVAQLQITNSAKQIVADFELLMLAGADVNTVMVAMQESVQKMVTQALAFGLQLPASMKPLIEQMIAAGLLVDDNGAKLTGLGNLTFADDLSKMFDELIKKLNELIAKITDGVGGALSKLPADLPPWYDPNTGLYLPTPSEPTPNTMAAGGVVPQYLSTGGHLLSFRPRGTDTVPAMLTPGEGVLSRRGMRALGELNAGRGNGGTINITVVSKLDGREVARNQVRYAPGALKAAGL